MEIPPDSLSSEALKGIIEAFVLREGTDYGHMDYSLEEKVQKVRTQLRGKEAKILYDDVTKTCNIVLVDQ